MKRWLRSLSSTRAVLAAALGLVGVAAPLWAQGTTGKIEGYVRDQAGVAVASARVLIVGSAFASSTNEQGYYFINNVPAGVMAVRAQSIGFAPAEVRNVRVLAGQTMTINVEMHQRAIEVTGITVTVERAPIVPRDQVTSKPIVQGDLVEQLPVDNVAAVLSLQPGVVEGTGRRLTVRGGRPGEAAVYIDGVLVRSVSGATSPITVGTNALEEVSVTTGAVGATLGDAQSGVISMVTRAGGRSLDGSISYATDEVSGQRYGSGDHRLEASLGGPLARNLTFFVAATMQGTQSARRGLGAQDEPIYVLNGTDTTITIATAPGTPNSDSTVIALPSFTRYSSGQRRPDDWSDAFTFDTKLQYTFGSGSRLSATYHRTRNQDLFYPGPGAGAAGGVAGGIATNLYNPQARTGSRSKSSALILNWTQSLTRSSQNALSVDASLSFQSDETIAGPLDAGWLQEHRTPAGWFSFSDVQFLVDRNNFAVDERLMQNMRVNNCQSGRDAARTSLGGCIPFINRNDLLEQAPYRTNPYGISPVMFPSAGLGNLGVNLHHENRISGRANFDWQANRYNRIQFGGDFVRSDVETFFSATTSLIFSQVALYSPTRFGLFAQNRIDLGDVVVDMGLRYDRLNSGLQYPRVPGRIFTDPLRHGDLSRARTAEDTAVGNRCAAALAAADTASWSTCNYFDSRGRGVLSPSLRVSFPVTDRTGFRLSYAHQSQTPDFSVLAQNVNADLSFTNTNDVFARDLDFGRSILFEFGVRHAFSDDMVLDISAYNKDKVSDITARIVPIYDPFVNSVQHINLVTNADFGNVRGIDVKLDRRIGPLFQATVAYTYQDSRSTGSDPNEYLNTYARQISTVTGERSAPPQALISTKDNRNHTIAGSLALNVPHGWRSGTAIGTLLQNTGAFATFRFASGLRYTRMQNDGAGNRGPGNTFGLGGIAVEELNASQMPWIRNVDLRVTRGISIGGREMIVFGDFRNLFNWSNLQQIFAETGNVTNAQYQESVLNPHRVTLQNEAGNLVMTRTINGQQVTGIDLSDCTQYTPGIASGMPNCLMLRGAEQRFGDGDTFFTAAEQEAAFTAWYRLSSAPFALRGPGFNARLGFEFRF